MIVVKPLEVVQEVEEGVAVGVRTGLQQGQQGDKPGVYVLDFYRGEKRFCSLGTKARLGLTRLNLQLLRVIESC